MQIKKIPGFKKIKSVRNSIKTTCIKTQPRNTCYTKKVLPSIMPKTLHLILGDQLNPNHSWFQSINPHVTYLMMECRSETDYTVHHIRKIMAFFGAMRNFAEKQL